MDMPSCSRPALCRQRSLQGPPPNIFFLPWNVTQPWLQVEGEDLCKQVFSLPSLVSPSVNQDTLWWCRLPLPVVVPATITGVVPVLVMLEKLKGEAWRAVSKILSTHAFPQRGGGFTILNGLFLVYHASEVRGAVGSHCWHTRAMSHAARRSKGMET